MAEDHERASLRILAVAALRPAFRRRRIRCRPAQADPDEGMVFDLDGARLLILPAHFLHSEGNFQLYDTVAKILYSGDLGASLGADYVEVKDFDAHIRFMEGFHRRYMCSNRVMKAWADMVRPLDIEIIAPQPGAYFKGKEMVHRFIDWCADLECGLDLMTSMYRIPAA